MAWTEYKPKPRGKAPTDFGAILANMAKPGDSKEFIYASRQSCNKVQEGLTAIAEAKKVALRFNLFEGTGEHKGYRLVVTRV